MRFSGRIERLLDAMDVYDDEFIDRFSRVSFENMTVESGVICNFSIQDLEILGDAQFRQNEIHKKRIGK